jgi:hypothetical protein
LQESPIFAALAGLAEASATTPTASVDTTKRATFVFETLNVMRCVSPYLGL